MDSKISREIQPVYIRRRENNIDSFGKLIRRRLRAVDVEIAGAVMRESMNNPIKEPRRSYFVLVLKRASIIYEIFAFSLTRMAYLASLAIFARYADYIYIENIIRRNLLLVLSVISAPPPVSRQCHLFHYPPTMPERYCQFNDYWCLLSEMRSHYHICLFGYNLFNLPPLPVSAARWFAGTDSAKWPAPATL